MDQILFRGQVASLEELALGASRIAGPPDLPIGLAWPRAPDGRHLPLVFQLALADLAAFPAARALPARGTLYFFAAQLVTEWTSTEVSNCPGAILHAPDGPLVRAAMPPEFADDSYWDQTHVSRIVAWKPNVAIEEHEEPMDDAWHVLFPVRKDSSISGLTPPDGFTPILEMRSDYALGMNWGDAAWATWIVPGDDLARATVNVWIG